MGVTGSLRADLGRDWLESPSALETDSELVKPWQVGVVTWLAPLTILCPPPGHRQRSVHLRV